MAVQGDGLEQQLVRRRACHLNDEMVPGVVQWIARYSRCDPFAAGIAVDVPLVPSGDAAFMSPDKRLSAGELVDIELQRLGCRNILGVEVNLVNKVMKLRHQGVICVRQALRRKISNEVVVPKNVGVSTRAADVVSSRAAADRWGCDVGRS